MTEADEKRPEDEIVAGDARKTAGVFVRLLGVKAAEWEARFGEPVAWDSVLQRFRSELVMLGKAEGQPASEDAPF